MTKQAEFVCLIVYNFTAEYQWEENCEAVALEPTFDYEDALEMEHEAGQYNTIVAIALSKETALRIANDLERAGVWRTK